MKGAIVFFDEKVAADIRGYMYQEDINSFSEAVYALVKKGIHAVCKEEEKE